MDAQELILRRDERLMSILAAFDSDEKKDATLLDTINMIIGARNTHPTTQRFHYYDLFSLTFVSVVL
jgi:hypothetical protein